MSFMELLLLALLLFVVAYVTLWLVLDCNVALWYKIYFGVGIASLRGQVVWITGASSGIGRALALNLARHGVRLAISARRTALLESVQTDCLKEAAGLLAAKDVLVLPMDMLQIDSHELCLRQVLDHFGHVDVLVNNAGRSQRASWEDIDVQVDRDLFELDVFSLIHLSRLVVRYFLQHSGGRGHVAVTSSIAGLGVVPYSATYCAAKHAVNAYLYCLKVEQPKIDITIFAPGPIATDFLQEAFTAVPNAKCGMSTQNQRRLSAERCGQLFAVSIANKMDLTWCGLFPVNFLAYACRSPTLSKIVLKCLGSKAMSKIREGKL